MKQKLLLLVFTLLLLFAMVEITISFLTVTDSDGNMSLNYIHLKPYKLPIHETEKKINALLQHKVADSIYNTKPIRKFKNVRLVPDTLLGWLPSPCYKGKNNIYIYNKDAIRSETTNIEYAKGKRIRIAIFGDSYSHGDEVPFENTIGYYLQHLFTKKNFDVEVINFGVSGYGIDQAYLRWQSTKKKFNPDIIILGVQFENVKRHINILRPFYYFITKIPYSKPRFVLHKGALVKISNPIKHIEKTVDIIRNFHNWKFANYEGFYSRENYSSNIFYYSKTVSFVVSALSQIFNEIDYYKPESESYKITYKLITQFKNDVTAEGKYFVPVHLPVKNDLDFLTGKFLKFMYNQKFIYDKLFSELKEGNKFVEPYDSLKQYADKYGINKLFMKRHYSPVANKIIAEKIFNFITTNYNTLFIPEKNK
jgi:hypothetical protein